MAGGSNDSVTMVTWQNSGVSDAFVQFLDRLDAAIPIIILKAIRCDKSETLLEVGTADFGFKIVILAL